MKVLHVITSLRQGGAETALTNLATGLHKKNMTQWILCMSLGNFYEGQLNKINVKVTFLNFRSFSLPFQLIKFAIAFKRYRPDIIQGWMYHANVFATMLSWFSKAKLIWSIHDMGNELKKRTSWFNRMSRYLSKSVDYIVYPTKKCEINHHYLNKNTYIIPNGCNMQIFRKFKEDEDKQFLTFGMLTRYDKVKNIPMFLRSAALASKIHSNIRFKICGQNIKENEKLNKLIKKLKLENYIELLNPISEAENYLNELDVFVLCSEQEAFANVVVEAMACELPIISTPVGVASELVTEEVGYLIKNNREALMDAMLYFVELTQEQRAKMGMLARTKVEKTYSIDKIVQKYEKLYIHTN